MIEFHLDTHSGVAAYLQIVQQVKQALRLGLLEVGDQLPTVREVVAQITINPNTVLKAYRELEREGLVRADQAGERLCSARWRACRLPAMRRCGTAWCAGCTAPTRPGWMVRACWRSSCPRFKTPREKTRKPHEQRAGDDKIE